MAITSFIPKLWSAKLQENFKRKFPLIELSDRSYEQTTEILQYGNTIHLNTLTDPVVRPYTKGAQLASAEELSGTDQTITIDHSVYCHFVLTDVDDVQSKADVLEAAINNAKRRIYEDLHSYLIGIVEDGAGVSGTIDQAEDMADQLIDIKTSMNLRNSLVEGSALVLPATVEGALMKSDHFKPLEASAYGKERGALYSACGFDIYVSNDLTDEVLAISPECLVLVHQINNGETYRPDLGFGTGYKLLSVSGAKIVAPDGIGVFSIS